MREGLSIDAISGDNLKLVFIPIPVPIYSYSYLFLSIPIYSILILSNLIFFFLNILYPFLLNESLGLGTASYYQRPPQGEVPVSQSPPGSVQTTTQT